MRVAHFMPYPGIGGTEIATMRVIQAANTAGVESIVFCLRPSQVLSEFFRDQGVPVVEWTLTTPSIRHGLQFYRDSRKLANEVVRLGVSLVHCQDMPAGFHGSLAGRLAGVPVLCHVRNRHDQISWRDQLFLKPVNRFLFVSKSTWQQFSLAVPESRGRVFYDGLAPQDEPSDLERHRTELNREFQIPSDAILIGMTARIHTQKDYATLLRSAAEVKTQHPNVVFLLVGEHSSDEASQRYFNEIQALSVELGVQDCMRFTGFRKDVKTLLHLFDIYVFSTNYEGFPLASLEAMACGKPVVATAVDGLVEQIENGKTGLLVPHKDHQALARSLVGLIDNPELATKLGTAARRSVETRFSDDLFRDRVTDLYRSYRPKN